MSITLASVLDQIEVQLSDTTNLIWSTTTLTEAVRSALAKLSGVYGLSLTLKDLDSAANTTFGDEDLQTLVTGSVAFALRYHLVRRFEEASPEDLPEDLALWSVKYMQSFEGALTLVRLRLFQQSTTPPYAGWD